jgi:hypothetical protein
MSEPFFYKLKAEGRGPKTMHVGGRTMISVEAAREWRRAMEADQVVDISQVVDIGEHADP